MAATSVGLEGLELVSTARQYCLDTAGLLLSTSAGRPLTDCMALNSIHIFVAAAPKKKSTPHHAKQCASVCSLERPRPRRHSNALPPTRYWKPQLGAAPAAAATRCRAVPAAAAASVAGGVRWPRGGPTGQPPLRGAVAPALLRACPGAAGGCPEPRVWGWGRRCATAS